MKPTESTPPTPPPYCVVHTPSSDNLALPDLAVKLVDHASRHLFGRIFDDGISMRTISTGLSNHIFHVRTAGAPAPLNECIVRVKKEGYNGCENDNTKEVPFFEYQAADDRFPNVVWSEGCGRVETYIAGRPMENNDFLNRPLARKVAECIRMVHEYPDPEPAEPRLWRDTDQEVEQMIATPPRNTSSSSSSQHRIFSNPAHVQKLANDVRHKILAYDPAVVFCHNDLKAMNMITQPDSETAHLIDFEYCGSNYQLYELANFFTEFDSYTYHDPTLASEDYQVQFCRWVNPTIPDTLATRDQFSLFKIASHLLWGAWHVNHNQSSSAPYYIRYHSEKIVEGLASRNKPYRALRPAMYRTEINLAETDALPEGDHDEKRH